MDQMETKMEIVVRQNRDEGAFFGSDPDPVANVDVQSSYDKFESLLAEAIRKHYPDAGVSVEVVDGPDRIDMWPDDSEIYVVEDILHTVWESWDWVVYLEAETT